MLDSYTMEEAPNQVLPWIRQRSRWIKGYMQTWLVHMRQPRQLYRTLGAKGFIGFQFFVGLSCFTFLTSPLVWGLSVLWMGTLAQMHHVAFPVWLMWLTMINLMLNIITHWYLALYCAILYRRHTLAMIVSGVLYPLYLILHSIASYKALWQLIVNPHFWEKTTHGLARHIDAYDSEHEVVQTR
jgi:glycosyltransferase XagB